MKWSSRYDRQCGELVSVIRAVAAPARSPAESSQIFAIAGPARLIAQTTFGSILGTVTDQSGAAIPGVSVTLTSLGYTD